MSFNGSGTFLINTAGQPVVSGTVISSTAFNALTADLATGLSTAITKDGQTTVTANIPMSTYKFTGLGVGSAATDSANLSQVQSTVTKLLNSVSGADTITATASPTLAAYAAGQMFYFVAAGDNTTSVTLNIDSLGAKAVTRDGSVALAAADIKSGEVIVVVYDGTRFQVVSQLNSAGDARFANVSIASSLYVGGVSTFVGNAGFSANVSIASALSVGGVAAITGATTIGGNLTLSGGTANGVLFLNGSKVATSGSALTFDGTDFKMPNGGSMLLGASVAGASLLLINGTAAAQRLILGTSGTDAVINATRTSGTSPNLLFQLEGANSMALTSTGLGIGTTSPAQKLDVTGTVNSVQARFGNVAGRGLTIGTTTNSGTNDAAVVFNAPTTEGAFLFQTVSDTKMTLSTSGSLGLGVTPRAWAGGYKSLDITGPGAIASTASGDTFTQVANGAWFNGTNWIYQYTGIGAARYQMTGPSGGGNHSWYVAGSGTAGNAISFTQAMTLDASGNLFCGGTTGSSRLNLQTATNSSTDSNYITLYNAGENVGHINWINGNGDLARITGTKTGAGASANDGILTFSTATDTVLTERARITSGGDLLVGTSAAGGSASNTTRVTGGIFSTFNATPSIASGTATTVATLPSGEGMYLVSASLLNSGTAADWNELALVRVSQSNTAVSTIVGAVNLDITVSGLNVQVEQRQGATQTIPVAIIRIM